MNLRRISSEFLAALLFVSIPLVALPVHAADLPATLSGSIVRSADHSPLAGARLHAGDPRTGEIFSSSPASLDGSFVLAEIPPSTYRLAVESDGGMYVVETPLPVAPGSTRTLNLAVQPESAEREDDPKADKRGGGKKGLSFKDNPVTATLAMLGVAVVVGVVIDEIDDDDDTSRVVSPSTPG